LSRFHYAEYHETCTKKGIAAKAAAPKGWSKPCVFSFSHQASYTEYVRRKLKQTNLTNVVQVVKKPPPFNKSTLNQFLLELIVDADLVSAYLSLYQASHSLH
jgi:hypothetical protein